MANDLRVDPELFHQRTVGHANRAARIHHEHPLDHVGQRGGQFSAFGVEFANPRAELMGHRVERVGQVTDFTVQVTGCLSTKITTRNSHCHAPHFVNGFGDASCQVEQRGKSQ